MATYLGYYRATDGFIAENNERARKTGTGADAKFYQMVVDLPNKLPASCTIIGSYSPAAAAVLGSAPPAIQIVETNDTRDLQFISNYYAGYLMFHWVPAVVVGGNKQQREAWRETVQPQPAGIR